MIKYIIIVAFGALSFGMLSSFAKMAYGVGYTAGEITFAQASIGALILWTIALLNKSKVIQTQSNKDKWKLLLAGLSMGISAYTYYLSVAYIPASLAIVLLMQMTWMSILLEWVFFGKKPSGVELTSAALIIAGTVLAGNLFNVQNFNFSIFGISLALLSGLLYSLYILFTSKLGKETPVFQKSALMTTGAALIILVINAKYIAVSNHLDFGLLKRGAFLAIFGTVIPPVCFSIGMPKIGAGLSSILLTLELPAAILCAHIILKEEVALVQVIGVLIMFAAIIYLNIMKAREKERIKSALIGKAFAV